MITMIHLGKNKTFQINLIQDMFDTWGVHEVLGNLINKHYTEHIIPCVSKIVASQLMFDKELKKRKSGYIYQD